jgi:hypothetical protein
VLQVITSEMAPDGALSAVVLAPQLVEHGNHLSPLPIPVTVLVKIGDARIYMSNLTEAALLADLIDTAVDRARAGVYGPVEPVE